MAITATDLDGTLLSTDTTVSKENLEAIKRLSQKGIETVVVTGRGLYEIPQELLDFDSIEYFIFSNGAGIYKRGSGVVFHSEINKKTAQRVVELLGNYEVFIELYINGTPTVDKNKFSEEVFDYYRIDRDFYPELKRSRKPVDNFEALLGGSLDGLEMFDLFFKNQEERAACAEAFNKYFPELEYTTSMTNNLEAMNFGINKGSGLMRLCEAENIDINDIYALGDSKNDLAMFEAVENCFAAANACQELKKISKGIACSNDENIMCFMEEFYKKQGIL